MSRAEPPPRRALSLVLGSLVVLALAFGFWFKLTRPKTARVPLGIAGFELGRTLAETERTHPKLEPIDDRHFRSSASFLDEPSTCTLGLGPAGTLTEIRCTLEAGQTAERRRQLRGKLLMTLRQLYGEESATSAAPALEHWEWTNDRALLIVEMPPVLSTGGMIEVANRKR